MESDIVFSLADCGKTSYLLTQQHKTQSNTYHLEFVAFMTLCYPKAEQGEGGKSYPFRGKGTLCEQ